MSTSAILIIDDDCDFAESLVDIAENEGYDVYCAQIAEEVKAIISQITVNIIFIDIKLADTDGITLAEDIRKVCSDTRFVFMTGFTSDKIRSDYTIPEGHKILYKPFKVQEFIQILIDFNLGK